MPDHAKEYSGKCLFHSLPNPEFPEYLVKWKAALNISTEIPLNDKLSSQVWELSAENCSNGSLSKVAKFHTNCYNFVACLPNPYKLSILGDIWRATNLPFSSSKHLYTWLRLSNLVVLSFEYPSFSNKRKTTILFLSPLTFLQWPIFKRAYQVENSTRSLPQARRIVGSGDENAKYRADGAEL